MNKITIISMVCVFLVSFVPVSYAVSLKECAIWLCLPSGFPAGCSDAYAAMRKRIKKGRSPLPPLASCIVSEKNVLLPK